MARDGKKKDEDYGLTGKSRKSNGDYGITGKARKSKEERDRSRDITKARSEARKEFTDTIQDHGGGDYCYPTATNKVYSRIFRGGKPDGDRKHWPEEDQQRIAVGEKSAAKQIREYGAEGDREIVEEAGKGAAEANRNMNDKGVQSVWDWFFNPTSIWDEPPEATPVSTPDPTPKTPSDSSAEEPIDELVNINLVQDLGSLAKWLVGM
jgi:hypothetical protein